ncbi:MAG: HAMP domain-containing protein, partial [Bdellovibrionales bacterium]|nr:HAMP domain-containing protein [Bdellovibrionales bacterium]
MTLVTRLSLFFLSMLAFVLIGFSVALYLLAASHLHRQTDERLESMLNAVSNIIEIGPHDVEWEPKNRTLNLDSAVDGDQVVWLVADDRGNVVERSQSRNTDLFLADATPILSLKDQAKRQLKWSGASWEAGQRWIRPEVRLPDHESPTHSQEDIHKYPALSVTVGVSLIPVRVTLTKLATALGGLSLAIWLLALVASRFVCQRALLPVHRMAAAAREIHADDLTQRLPASATNDELADLNRAFNNLLDRLQVAFERQQRFTGDASHQLRTPLTAILGQIEVTLRRDRPAEEYRNVLEKVQRRASHLAGMTEALLFLARADAEAMLPA